MLASLPGMFRVFFFIIFIFSIFAIFGTNQFMGQQYQFCRSQEDAEYDENNNFISWPKSGEDDDGPVLCREDSQCIDAFPDDDFAICGTVFEKFGLDPIEHDGIRDIELIMFGIPGFDNVGQGFLTIFQILTLESWVYLMYNFSDAGSPIISVIFFVMVVLLGAFFTMNLVLAIIVESFDANQNDGEGDDDGEGGEGDEGEKDEGENPKLEESPKNEDIKILDDNADQAPQVNGDQPDNALPELGRDPNAAATAMRIANAELHVAQGRNVE